MSERERIAHRHEWTVMGINRAGFLDLECACRSRKVVGDNGTDHYHRGGARAYKHETSSREELVAYVLAYLKHCPDRECDRCALRLPRLFGSLVVNDVVRTSLRSGCTPGSREIAQRAAVRARAICEPHQIPNVGPFLARANSEIALRANLHSGAH